MSRAARPVPQQSGTASASHDDIMAKLGQIEQSAHTDRQRIDARLEDGNRRFEAVEKAILPFTQLIEAMGGEEQFKDLAFDAARGLAAIVWVGSKLARLMKWATAVLAGAGAIWLAARHVIVDLWRAT